MANLSLSLVSAGLNTITFKAPTTDTYAFQGTCQIPSIPQGAGPSSLVITINQNGSPVYTGSAGAEGFYTTIACTAADTITIVPTSSAAADQGLNVIKITCQIFEGTF